MGSLIDTSVLIAVERSQLDLDEIVAQRGEGAIALAAITASELLHGVHRARPGHRRELRERFVEGVLNRFTVVPFALDAARTHAALWSDLARRGTPIGERDLMIAATAISVGFSIATRDRRSFPKIPGLAVEVL